MGEYVHKKIIYQRRYAIFVIILVICALVGSIGWKIPVIWKIETLKLPDGCETVYPLKVEMSDVHWWHISGEKVIACDAGYDAAKAYIESHNSIVKLHHLSICGYGSMSCDYIYDSEYDEYFEEHYNPDEYVKIVYERKIGW